MSPKKCVKLLDTHLNSCAHCKAGLDNCPGVIKILTGYFNSQKRRNRFASGVIAGVGYAAIPFRFLDWYLMRIVTRISHTLQRWCGLTNYFIARSGALFVLTAVALHIANYFLHFMKHQASGVVLFFLFLWIPMSLGRIKFTHKADDAIWSNTLQSPGIHTDLLARMMWSFFVIFDVALLKYMNYHPNPFLNYIAECGVSQGMWIFTYFIAVIPLPPGPTKIGDLFRGLMPRQLAHQENK